MGVATASVQLLQPLEGVVLGSAMFCIISDPPGLIRFGGNDVAREGLAGERIDGAQQSPAETLARNITVLLHLRVNENRKPGFIGALVGAGDD